jgi:hypothetical protein
MTSREGSTPIDIPQQRSNISTPFQNQNQNRARNLGQHTANFIDPNLMQLSPNNRTSPGLSDLAEANRDKEVQASRSMPPPPIPSQSSHPADTTATGYQPKSPDHDRHYVDYMAAQRAAPAPGPKIVTAFYPKLNEVYSDMKKKEEAQKAATLNNNKPVPQSIAILRHMSNSRNSRPNIYNSPYSHGHGSADGATIKEGITTNIDEGDKQENDLDDEEWLHVKQAPSRSKEDDEARLDSGYIRVEIERDAKAKEKKNKIDPVAGGLANSYYVARSEVEQRKIDGEKKKLGWFLGGEK